MNKKIFPYLLLVLAVLLYVLVKQHQGKPSRDNIRIETNAIVADDFNRTAQKITYSKHALCRMECRYISDAEVRAILAKGTINTSKIQRSQKGISVPLEGRTSDGKKVRIVFAPKGKEEMVVVTVIDLEQEYVCDCK
ncbi:MAG: DUF4258 domain-containing protein [Ferruginibacter sp.]